VNNLHLVGFFFVQIFFFFLSLLFLPNNFTMVPDQSTASSTTTPAPKGLAAMFGGSMPSKYQTPATRKPFTATLTSAKSNDLDQSSAGGSWKSVSKRKGGMSLAARARLGKNVTVASSPRKQQGMDDDDDVSMGGMGKKKKRL
jgi:hypothetical protein